MRAPFLKRALAAALCLLLCLTLLPVTALAAESTDESPGAAAFDRLSASDRAGAGRSSALHTSKAGVRDGEPEGLRYLDPTDDAQPVKYCQWFTPYTGQTDLEGWGDWYAMQEETLEVSERINIQGDINLILCDGTTLKALGGIQVEEGSSLTLWGQSWDCMGVLLAGTDGENSTCGYGYAGIGGSEFRFAGQIAINGGAVTAMGGENAAAIGGGAQSGLDKIAINGGRVTASAFNGAEAIGRGNSGYGSGELIIGDGMLVRESEDGEPVPADSREDFCRHEWVRLERCKNHDGGGFDAHCNRCGLFCGIVLYQDPTEEYAQEKECNAYELFRDQMTLEDGRWYAADANTERLERITVQGEVNLILCDGIALTILGGLELPEDSSLTVWAHSEDDKGALLAGTNGWERCCDSGKAGIGGSNASGGSLIINGGEITARGGEHAAGIGGGASGESGAFIFRSGSVTAIAEDEAEAIGRGENGENGCILELNGARVYDSEGSSTPVDFRSREEACRGSWVRLTVCDDHNDSAWLDNHDGETHRAACLWCGRTSDYFEPHTFEHHVCTGCGACEPISYADPADESEPVKTCPEYVVYTGQTELENGVWYAVLEDAAAEERICVNGTGNLLLCRDTTLTAGKGIRVPGDSSLTIWSESENGEAGVLLAGTDGTETLCEANCAAIGGNDGEQGGAVTINGGAVTAFGGSGAAGVGSGSNAGGGSLTLRGGELTVRGGQGAQAIGCGANQSASGELNLDGLRAGPVDEAGTAAWVPAGSREELCRNTEGQALRLEVCYPHSSILLEDGEHMACVCEWCGSDTGEAHVWGEASYVWAEDSLSCTGSCVCTLCQYVETETAAATPQVTLAPTCTEPGQTTYTAVFTSTAFAAQTRTLTDVPALGHSFTAGIDKGDGTHDIICARCGEPNGVNEPHVFEHYVCVGCGLHTTVPYLDTSEETDFMADCYVYTIYTGQKTLYGGEEEQYNEDEEWYVVTEDVTVESRITVLGHVNLLLCDGATLTALQGIEVNNTSTDENRPNSLTVWAQSDGENTGVLFAGTDGTNPTIECGYAGIGGGPGITAGSITICGGVITAAGVASGHDSSSNDGRGGAGIGGGGYTKTTGINASGSEGGGGGAVTIHGGTVTATGGSGAAGIGSGRSTDGSTTSVLITGGTVNATGGSDGKGIGSYISTGGTVTITGGTVNATGGAGGAGIGDIVTITGGVVNAVGKDSYGGGAGIGGSRIDLGSSVVISGGTVTATGGYSAAGIGGGGRTRIDQYHNMPNSGSDSGSITITGGTVIATGGEGGAGIGGGKFGAGETILLSGGSITAVGRDGGAGIGGGYQGASETITISGGTVTVRAENGTDAQTIGHGGNYSEGDATEAENILNIPGMKVGVVEADSGEVTEWVLHILRDFCCRNDSGDTIRLTECDSHVFADGVCTFCGTSQNPLPYFDPTDGAGLVKLCTAYETYFGQTVLEDGKWYAVTADAEVSERITVSGTVNLILCDGAALTAGKGVSVNAGNSLTIWGQEAGTGVLTATAEKDYAGIGGDYRQSCGVVVINGGYVSADTGDGTASAAGIGGGRTGGGGTVRIHGGTVYAQGKGWSAGIGGGAGSGNSGTTTNGGAGGTVEITGGDVTVVSGYRGAGIGGANGSPGGDVTITGGDVTITVAGGGQPIGGGERASDTPGTLTLGQMRVTTPANTLADDRVAACQALSGVVTLVPCTEHVDDSGFCRWCGALTSIPYLDPTDENEPVKYCTEFEVYTGQHTLEDGVWYVVTEDVSVGRITIYRTANLILCDGATLTTEGVAVDNSSDLTVWAQSEGDGMGALIADASSNAPSAHWAGIGGTSYRDMGNITINGGAITAMGVPGYDKYTGSAGIGPGAKRTDAYPDYDRDIGNITINGGRVNAVGGSEAAGIGGLRGITHSTVTVNGGVVSATGGSGGPGIVGGYEGNAVIINGGDVTAVGGFKAPGIGVSERVTDLNNDDPPESFITITGGTVSATGGLYGAGIVSSSRYSSSWDVYRPVTTVAITGGTVTATGGNYGAGIGGSDQKLCGSVYISGGSVTAYGGQYAAGIGSGDECADNFEDKLADVLIAISGGTVTAEGGSEAAGIGGGRFSDGLNVEITGGTVTVSAEKDVNAQKIGHGRPSSDISNEGNLEFPGMKVGAVDPDSGEVSEWFPEWDRDWYCRDSYDFSCIRLTVCEPHVYSLQDNGETHGGVCEFCGTEIAEAHVWGEASYVWAADDLSCVGSYVCSVCQHAETETAAAEAQVSLAPTCTEQGQTTYTAVFTDPLFETQTKTVTDIPALGHDLIHHEAQEPTCTEIGWEAYDTCSRCDYSTYQETPALGHDLIQHAAQEPTCAEIGWAAYDTCSRCDYSTYEETPALGHDLIHHEAQEPTCTEIGWAAYDTCSRCDYSTYEEIPTLGHDLIHHEAQEPTCTEIGWAAYDTCSRCDYSTYEETPALGHDLIHHEAQEPTCTEIGWAAYDTCSRCDYSTYEETPALGHDLIHHEAQEPTCAEIGWAAYDTCSRCDYSTYEETPALGHDLIHHAAQEPTCTEPGWEAYETCSRCDYSTYQETPALGHDLIHHEAQEPTCTEIGWAAYDTCSRCDFSTYQETPALGHLPGEPVQENYVEPAVGAAGGYDLVTYCQRCGALLESVHTTLPAIEEDPALHVFTSISVGTDMILGITARKSEVSGYERFWIEVVKHGPEGDTVYRYGPDQAEPVIENPASWRASFRHVCAKEMGVEIEARLFVQDAAGQIFASPARTTCIRDYLAERLTATNNTVEQRVLAADMLNYGAAAQRFMDYDAEHLVNKELSDEALAKLREYETTEEPLVEKTNSNLVPEGQEEILFNSVTLGNEVVLTLTVALPEEAETVQVLVRDHVSGETVAVLDASLTRSSYQAEFRDIGADKMRTEYDFVTLADGVETGNTRIWSVEAYVGEIRGGSLPLKTAMANALLAYGDSAAAYFAAQ